MGIPKAFTRNSEPAKRGNAHTMVIGDVRSSGWETTNDDLKNFYEQEVTVDGRSPLEIDREYNMAMQKVRKQTLNMCGQVGRPNWERASGGCPGRE